MERSCEHHHGSEKNPVIKEATYYMRFHLSLKYPEQASLQRQPSSSVSSWANWDPWGPWERLLLDNWATSFFLQMQECSKARLGTLTQCAGLGTESAAAHGSPLVQAASGALWHVGPQFSGESGVLLPAGRWSLALDHQVSPNSVVLIQVIELHING